MIREIMDKVLQICQIPEIRRVTLLEDYLKSSFPSLSLIFLEDKKEQFTLNDFIHKLKFSLIIADKGKEGEVRKKVQDLADQIEERIKSNPTLDGLALNSFITGRKVDSIQEKDYSLGVVRLELEVIKVE